MEQIIQYAPIYVALLYIFGVLAFMLALVVTGLRWWVRYQLDLANQARLRHDAARSGDPPNDWLR